MKTIVTACVLLMGLFVRGAFPGGQGVSENSEDTLSSSEAIKIMRAVNTAEGESLALSKHVLNMQAVREHRFVKKLDSQIGLTQPSGSDSSVVKDYEVRLLLAQDQQQYTLTLRPLKGGECTPIFMTNETGVLYQGVPASCQQSQQTAAK